MQRFRGHFYNWYDLHDLRVLEPAYISTVDSGNLAGHLIALRQACLGIPDDPAFDARVWRALQTGLALAAERVGGLSASTKSDAPGGPPLWPAQDELRRATAALAAAAAAGARGLVGGGRTRADARPRGGRVHPARRRGPRARDRVDHLGRRAASASTPRAATGAISVRLAGAARGPPRVRHLRELAPLARRGGRAWPGSGDRGPGLRLRAGDGLPLPLRRARGRSSPSAIRPARIHWTPRSTTCSRRRHGSRASSRSPRTRCRSSTGSGSAAR